MKKALLLKTVVLLVFLACVNRSKAQSLLEDTVKRVVKIAPPEKTRAAFLELGGPGLALTLNYDARFGTKNNKWGFRIGGGYYNTGANWVASIPFQINYLYGGDSSFLEVGAGTTFVRSVGSINGTVFQFDNITGFIGTASIGYRYQQSNGGINFRIAFVPILYDAGVIYEGGLSIGYTF
jgi:hypothetical protein